VNGRDATRDRLRLVEDELSEESALVATSGGIDVVRLGGSEWQPPR
jgi:hypothetical protein